MEATMNRVGRGRAASGGALAGILSGIVLAIYLVVMSITEGGDMWQPLKGAGFPFLGERAFQPGFDLTAVLVGVGAHLGVSMIWGLLFGVLFYGASKLGTLVLGAAWGVVVWLVMYYLVLPIAGIANMPETVPLKEAVLSHVIFGVALAMAFLPYQRRRLTEYETPTERLERLEDDTAP
jgi:hypothetical protein